VALARSSPLRVLPSRQGNELVEALEGKQPNISKHLALLHNVGLMVRRRNRTSVLYCINDPVVLKLCDLVCRNKADHSQRDFAEFRASLKERERE
jgi:DNA-binding transcriptional ArsR family regulator